jgi:hypothetical protein
MSVYEEQQARKRSEPPARSWDVTLAAIRAARGAREGVAETPMQFEIWTNGRDLFAEPMPVLECIPPYTRMVSDGDGFTQCDLMTREEVRERWPEALERFERGER